MNYIELEIGGEKRGFRLGLGFLGGLLEDMDIGMTELSNKLSKNPFKTIPLMMYHSAICDLERKGEPVDFTKFDIIDWIEELEGGFENKVVVDFLNAFTKSMTKDIPKEEKSDKKKVRKTA